MFSSFITRAASCTVALGEMHLGELFMISAHFICLACTRTIRPAMARSYWLMKSEPSVFSIHTLEERKVAPWDGVRNFMARNHMRRMKVGDRVIFWHSSEEPVGPAGVAEVAREAYPDHTSWDPQSEYYDPKAVPGKPRWEMVDVSFVEAFPRVIPIERLRRLKAMKDAIVLRRGNRLSVTPLTKREYDAILALANKLG